MNVLILCSFVNMAKLVVAVGHLLREAAWYLLMRLIAKYFSYLISVSVIVSSLLYRIRIWYVVQTKDNSNNKTKQSLVEFPICLCNYYRIDDMSARML